MKEQLRSIGYEKDDGKILYLENYTYDIQNYYFSVQYTFNSGGDKIAVFRYPESAERVISRLSYFNPLRLRTKLFNFEED